MNGRGCIGDGSGEWEPYVLRSLGNERGCMEDLGSGGDML